MVKQHNLDDDQKGENFRMMHHLQYERIDHLEQRREFFFNLVITLSLGLIAVFHAENAKIEPSGIVILSSLSIVINLAAILFAIKSRAFVKMHQERAESLLYKYARELILINESVHKPDSEKDILRRNNLYMGVHFTMILALFFEIIHNMDRIICNYLIEQLVPFFIGIIGGVISSFIVIQWQVLSRDKKGKKNFKFMEGTYHHFGSSGLVVGSELKMKFKSPNLLLIKSTAAEARNNWEGTIIMNELNPQTGSGVYEIMERTGSDVDWGTISIQTSLNDKSTIFVISQSFAQGTNKVSYRLEKQIS